MANEEHVARLMQGVRAWNNWRSGNRNLRPNLHAADLHEANLSGADLREADLTGVNLFRARLIQADLIRADLTGVKLREANLFRADLTGANLNKADLYGANLSMADLSAANLHGALLGMADLRDAKLIMADLTRAILTETVLTNIDLSEVRGLETCRYGGPSSIDHRTLARSGNLPVSFLRGVGLPDRFIDYLPSLQNQPIQFYSCFISYSAKDQEFAERLHADLQNKGVRCWFARHDMPIGAKIIDTLDEAIRLRDKVLLILSEHAIASDWVEGEVTTALEEERTRKQNILFPVRIDDAVLQTSEPWARLLCSQRNIGNFTRWKDHDSYQESFKYVMRDLEVDQAPRS